MDRLYELLPVVYRMRDAERGDRLKALLRVITEQVNLVEDDIAQLYENWFIETCEDWVVPYIGDLVGYDAFPDAGLPAGNAALRDTGGTGVLFPRREVANMVRYRRRKGTLAVLELISNDVAGWPARAAEFYRHLGWTQALNHQQAGRGRVIDTREGGALELLDGPFDELAHTVNVRRIDSRHTQGRHNLPSVGVFVWRLESYSVTGTPAYCLESAGPHCFTFSVLGNDSPLYMNPVAEPDPTDIADEFNLPVPIRRRLFDEHKTRLYGDGKSLQIWVGKKQGDGGDVVPQPVPPEQIVPADLGNWRYLPRNGTVAVDPVLGRIAFPTRQLPRYGVWVSYRYGFSADMGGGEYERPIAGPESPALYRVGGDADFATIGSALQKWRENADAHAVIEITDSGVYVEQINIEFNEGQLSLQLRAENRRRPIVRLLDWQTDRPDSLTVTGAAGNCFVLDGLTITGRGVQIAGDLADVTIRHTTIVPGWTLDGDCEPQRATEPSLEVNSPSVCVKVQHSIVGPIQVIPLVAGPESQDDGNGADDDVPDDEAALIKCRGSGQGWRLDPIRICISDSIVDATDPGLEAIGAPGCLVAHACLTIARTTVFGRVQAHTIELGENSIFDGRVTVARRQTGCMRFCYVAPGSRTPRRYRCQPDLAEQQAEAKWR
ncbi:MAG: hypothetical protein AAFX58_13435, partial [Pseudomonadota bacterium]